MFETRTLENGTRFLLANQPEAQSAAAMVMFSAGSRYEESAEAGIAHFAEHLFFKGTERRPSARDISFEVDSMGADFNAFTGKEYTGYYIKCTRDQVAQALDVISDMLFHSRFDPEEVEREKGVIVEEMNMYTDTPAQYLPDVYDNLCFGDTPLGRPIIGNKDSIRDAKRDTFTGYLDRWYAPERTFVGLGGGLEDSAIAAAEELFGSRPIFDTADYAPFAPATRDRVRLHTKDSDQFHLRIGGDGLPIGHPDRYIVQLLTTVLGGGMSSRLFSEVRERRGLAYYVYAQHGQYLDAGSLYTQAGVDLARADEAVRTILAELRKMRDEPVPADELAKAKSYVRGRLVLGLEDPRSIISFGLRGLVLEGKARELTEVLDGFSTVSADDIQRVAADLLRPEALRIAAIGPVDDVARFETLLDEA
ncbi:MAG: pitrilysin family protein [Gaiellales bacterium]